MLKIVLIAVVLGVAAAQEQFAQVLRSESENVGNGNFRYNYETSNGIAANAEGYIKNPNARSEDQIQVIQGSYSYYGPDGVYYTVTYIADENGFQPQGAHLPSNGAGAARPVNVRGQRPRGF